MLQNIAILLLAVMVVVQKHQTDKQIKQLKQHIQIQNDINIELINTTKELLKLNDMTVRNMIMPICQAIGLKLRSSEKPKK